MSNGHAWAWNSHGTVWIDTRLTPRHGVWMKLREGATEIESWFVEFLSPKMHPKEHLQLDAVTFTSVSRQILLTLLCFILKTKKNIMTNLTPSIRVMGCEGNRSAWESEPPLHGTCENVLLLAVYVKIKSYRKYYTHYSQRAKFSNTEEHSPQQNWTSKKLIYKYQMIILPRSIQIQPGAQRESTILRLWLCTGGQLLLAEQVVAGSLLGGSDEIQAAPPRFDAGTHGTRCRRKSDGMLGRMLPLEVGL